MRTRLAIPLVLLLVACGGDDRTASWQSLSSDEAGALLSVWGTSGRDVWAVGGRGEIAGAPAILHLEGETWRRVDCGLRGLDLWWVFGFDGGDVFFTGAKGTILRYRNTVFEPMETPRSGTI